MNNLDYLARKYGTDKRTNNPGEKLYHGYTVLYQSLFENMRNSCKNLLEIGVREGWSHKMWHDYFPKATIYGIDNFSDSVYSENPDIKNIKNIENDRIKIFVGDQADKIFL